MNLLRQHRQKIEAQLAQADDSHANLDAYEMMLVRLRDDVLRIKSCKALEAKNNVKREVLPNYLAWVEGVITAVDASSDNARQDDVFAQAFVWAVDLLDLPLAIRMFSTMRAADMQLPERFKRSAADFLVEQVANMINAQDTRPRYEDLQAIEDLTADIDMHDEIRAKWFKAMGTLHEGDKASEASLTLVISYFERALKLDSGAGVKRRLDDARRALKKMQENE